MAVAAQEITDRYAVYNGDCIEVIPGLKDESVHATIYSPPFAELYNYSSSEHDLSNCRNYEQFLEHYGFLIDQIARVTMPGRISCVHCMDLRITGKAGGMRDFPGDIIRMYQARGFAYQARHCIWKEPLRMAIKTRALGLRHAQIVKDSGKCHAANAEYLLVMRKEGENPVPIAHPMGITKYVGERVVPPELLARYGNGWKNQKTNKLSQWIWQKYASSFWDDIRVKRVLPFREGRDSEDEKHICPLQLDVIERCLVLYTNPGEIVLTPFMGVGSEVYGALIHGRRAIGTELKPSYYRQAIRNIHAALENGEEQDLFARGATETEEADIEDGEDAEEMETEGAAK